MDNKIKQWAEETRISAANIEHAWDEANVNWPGITTDSHVLEIGSYKGRWALQMAQRYNPNLYCFEPQLWAYETTCEVLKGYPKTQVFNYALGVRGGRHAMTDYGTDGCKLVPGMGDSHRAVLVHVRNVFEVLVELGIPQIDLALVNIEGYEDILLPYMFKNGIYPRRLSVQFHGGNYEGLRRQIEAHYKVLWDYGKTLTAFVLKGVTGE